MTFDRESMKLLALAATMDIGPRRVETDYNGVHQVLGDGGWKILNAWHTPDGKGMANAEFYAAASPSVMLILLEEIDRLNSSYEQICGNYNRVSFASEERGKQVDQLKAENDALRKDAERYRRLRDGGYLDKFVSVHPCDENRRTELTDEAIDRVMGTE